MMWVKDCHPAEAQPAWENISLEKIVSFWGTENARDSGSHVHSSRKDGSSHPMIFIEAQINSISMRATWVSVESACLFCFPAFYGSMWKSLWFKCLIAGEPEWWRAGAALWPTICLFCCLSSLRSLGAQTSYLASLGSDLVHSRKKWTTWFTQ